MGHRFAADGDKIIHNSVPLGTITDGTIIIYAMLTDAAARQVLCNQLGTADYSIHWRADQAGDPLQVFRGRGSVYAEATANIANFANYGLNKPLMIVACFSTTTAGDNKLLIGDLGKPPAAPSSYTTQTAGSGTIDTTNADFSVGNGGITTREFHGTVYDCDVWKRVLTPAEILDQWNLGRHRTPENVLFTDYRNEGRQPDLSGYHAHGIVTGAKIAEANPFNREHQRRIWSFGSTAGSQQFTQDVGGSLTPSGAMANAVGVTRGGGITPAGAVVQAIASSLAGALTPAGAVNKAVGNSPSGVVAPAGAVTDAVSITRSGSVTPQGSLAAAVSIALGGAITPAGTLDALKVILLSLTGSLTPTGAIVRDVAIARGGSITPSAALINAVAKTLNGGMTPSGTLDSLRVIMLALAGSLTPSGVVGQAVAITRTGSITPTGAVTKAIAKAFSGALGLAGTIANLVGGLTAPGRVRATMSVVTVVSGVNSLVTLVTSTTSAATGLTASVTAATGLAVTDRAVTDLSGSDSAI